MESGASLIPIGGSRSKSGKGSGKKATSHKPELRPLARVETSLEVKRGKQVRPKKQPLRLNRLHKCAPQDPGSARGAGRVALRGTRAGNRDYCSPIDR
jgi:hypothetical protein